MSWFKRDRKTAEPPGPPSAVLGSLEIRKPWARRSADTPDQAGVYFLVANTGDTPDRLVGVACPLAASATLHGIKVVGPVIQMRPLENGLALPGGESRELKPRGYHVLLEGVAMPPAPGDRLTITLQFEKAGDLVVGCIVEAPGPVGDGALDQSRN